LVFNATSASLFNDEMGNDPTLYDAFTVFDSYVPLAVAGVPMKNFRKFTEARDHLYKAVHKVPFPRRPFTSPRPLGDIAPHPIAPHPSSPSSFSSGWSVQGGSIGHRREALGILQWPRR